MQPLLIMQFFSCFNFCFWLTFYNDANLQYLYQKNYFGYTVPFAASNVFFNRPIIVIKPTPPGTGVIQDALGATASKSTSPYSLKPDFVSVEVSRLIPTSITIAPSFTISPVTKFFLPIAATTISP